jgi:hypothetical protein
MARRPFAAFPVTCPLVLLAGTGATEHDLLVQAVGAVALPARVGASRCIC